MSRADIQKLGLKVPLRIKALGGLMEYSGEATIVSEEQLKVEHGSFESLPFQETTLLQGTVEILSGKVTFFCRLDQTLEKNEDTDFFLRINQMALVEKDKYLKFIMDSLNQATARVGAVSQPKGIAAGVEVISGASTL